MNQFKQDLQRELQTVSLSTEKKQLIATKAKAKLHNQKRRINWQYRFVLSTFTILAFSFSYLLWQQEDSTNKSLGATPIEPIATANWSLLTNDFSKSVLFISFFIGLRALIKWRLGKSGKVLPVCVECGEEWTYRQALKDSMKNSEITCPHCRQKQYRTKKSVRKSGMLNLFIPFVIIIPRLFDHFLLGFVVYLACALFLIVSLSPYFLEFQEEDHFNEPLW